MAVAQKLIYAALFFALFGAPARGDDAPAPAAQQHCAPATPLPPSAPAPAEAPKLPPDKITAHSVTLPDRKLAFKASVSTIHIPDAKGAPEADIVATAYLLDGADASKRPLAFVFNGGPGSASAFLQFGALGPWRLPFDFNPSATPATHDNADTWLDFTDLVFVDPPGTGYSRIVASGEGARKRIWSIGGDIDVLAAAVRQWLAANERLASPKYIVGESYGGFRAPRLAETLATKEGVGVRGLVLVSPVLDFATFFNADEANPMEWAARLPSFAAVAREAKGPVSRAGLADVEAYASTDYILDFLRGARDAAALERMSDRVAALTGLDRALVAKLQGRVGIDAFTREFARAQGKILAPHDASIEAYDPEPQAYQSRWLDPGTDGLAAQLTSAAVDVYERRLGWKSELLRYEVLNHEVNRAWDWGRGLSGEESGTALRRVLALDPRLRVLIAHGFTDLVTPYFAAKLLIDQIPDFGPANRVTLAVYPGGHMLYARDESRKALRRDAQRLFEGK